MGTYGPDYDEQKDGQRIARQMDVIREYMLQAALHDIWKTLHEISTATGYPEASVSAQLRHLRKERFGGYIVNKRRRNDAGTWEYILLCPEPAEFPTTLWLE